MSEYHRPDAKKVQTLKDIANTLRINSIKMTSASSSGHPTSCCSMAEIMSVLFFHTMRYSIKEPRGASSDRFVLSKGHAAPILYAAWSEAGLFPESELMKLRKLDSDLEGHPTPRLSFVDVATGSLGQGLSVAAGMAYTGKYFDGDSYRVYCLIGDGESAEGAIWEAISFGSHYKLDNLVTIIDINRLGQSDPTALGHNTDVYQKRMEAFGWHTVVVDGHDVEALCKAFHSASTVKDKPTCILAKTFKGKGCPEIENELNWHGKALGAKADNCIATVEKFLKSTSPFGVKPLQPEVKVPKVDLKVSLGDPPSYDKNKTMAVREAYGNALKKIGKNNNRVVALDGDMKNSTFSNRFQADFPERFIECYIAEQNMVGVGIGCACRDRCIVFMSTFAAFYTRAFDQIRMGAVSQTNINIAGSHCGVSIGEDGPSQMALEDIAMFRSVPNATVFYPSDAVSCERAVELAANTKGMCFIRVTRPNTPILYSADEKFEVGKAKVIRSSSDDKVTIVAACITLTEASKAAETLQASGTNVRIIDPFTVKPIDAAALIKNARETSGRILTVEDHYIEGGLGEAVASAVCGERDIMVKKLAVTEIPRSGKPAELLEKYGISANCIVKAVNQMLSQ